MTREEKIKVLAELGGWKWLDHPDTKEATKNFTLPDKWVIQPDGVLNFPHNTPRYLTSYDAIIPLVKKRCAGNALLEQTFINEIERGICSGFHAARTVGFFPIAAEPEQLADALIKSLGKWKE